MISPNTFQFLNGIRKNNNRTWFDAHRNEYQQAKQNVTDYLEALNAELSKTDVIEQYKLFRIFRDVRFSKDKTPYKSNFSGYLRRAGRERRGGYFLSIAPGNTQIGGGFYGPNKEDLFRIRKEFEFDTDSIQAITSSRPFLNFFGEMQGEVVKTAPKGFSKEHPNIDWIRRKQFYVFRTFSDQEVEHETFVQNSIETFKALRPFFDYMSLVLTTDLNGEQI